MESSPRLQGYIIRGGATNRMIYNFTLVLNEETDGLSAYG
jgi:hypothetical protein